MPIWPMPKEYSRGDRTIVVDPYHFHFVANMDNSDIRMAMDRYMDLIFGSNRASVATTAALLELQIDIKNYDVPLNVLLANHPNVQFGVDESYELYIPEDGSPALITANTIFGAYHGLESFSQLVMFNTQTGLYQVKGAPWHIQDAPAYPVRIHHLFHLQHRGMLIDSVRHFLPIPVVKKIFDSLVYSKFNALHWHLSDNEAQVLQSFTAPRFWDSAYTQYERYTQADMREIVEYARQRGIRVIPEIDVPGHMKSWCTVYPEVCPSTDCPEPIDPSNENAFNLLDGFIGEMTGREKYSGIFFDDFFHLGGDEVDTHCWEKTPRIREWMEKNQMTVTDTYKYTVDRAHQIVFGFNRTAVNWEEVVTHIPTPVDKRAIIHIWLCSTPVSSIVEKGYNVIISRRWYLDDLDNTWEVFYNNDITQGVSEDRKKQILGGEACMWAESVDTSNWFNTVWPRAAAVGEHLWTPREKHDVDAALNRIIGFRCLLNRRGIEAAPVLNLKGRAAPLGQGGCYWQ